MLSYFSSARRRQVLFVASSIVAAQASAAFAGTLAYWRFEGDGINTPTDGAFVTDTNARTAVQPTGVPGYDSSGNGNTLYTWDDNGNGHQYRPNVPSMNVPRTGAANSYSLQNNGNTPGSFTWSRESIPSVDIEPVKPLAWTIEASVLTTNTSGFRTIVGRNGNSIATDQNLAPLYFQTIPGGRLRINYTDEAGVNHFVDDSTGVLSTNTWYNIAAVSDGSTLKLFRDSGLGFLQVGSLNLAGTSADTRLGYDDNGSTTPNDSQWGWTVGSGRYGAADGQENARFDNWLGNLDEIRISDSALAPSEFLFASTVVVNPTNLTWVGGSNGNVWDVNTTPNFKLPSNAPSTFKQNDNATFDGTGTTTVTVAGTVAPFVMTVSGSVDQTFDGTGTIGGAGSLVKSGSGKLTLSNTGGNGYGGGTTISGGVVELTGAGLATNPMLGTGPVTNNGQIISNMAAGLFIANDISGTGSIVVKQTTILSGNSTFDGTVTIENGVLYLDSATALGSAVGGTVIQNGAKLYASQGNFNYADPLTVEGNANGGGAIQIGGGRNMTFSGPLTLGATSNLAGFSIDGGSTLNFTGPVTSTTSVDISRTGPGTLRMPAPNANVLSLGAQGTTQLTSGVGTIRSLVIPFAPGRLDISKAGLAIDYEAGASPVAEVLAMLADGRLATTFEGFVVGIIDNATLNTPLASMGGVAVDGTSVLIRGTYAGDANLDQGVNFTDLVILAQNYNGSGKTWGQGDSDYDGNVNFSDLVRLAQNYNRTAPVSSAALVAAGFDRAFAGDWALANALVPEPATMSALAFLGLALGGRGVRRGDVATA